MTQVTNSYTGNQEIHFLGKIVSIAAKAKETVKSNGEPGAPYKPFSVKFENVKGDTVTRSGLLFVNQFPEAVVGDEIPCAVIQTPGRKNSDGKLEELLIVSRLEAAERATAEDFDFSEVSVAQDAPVAKATA